MSARVQTLEWLNRRIDELEAEKTPLYTDRITNLQQQLDAANQRNEELDHSYQSERAKVNTANYRIAELEISNRDGQRLINELNGQLADSERAKADAERKLARVLAALGKADLLCAATLGSAMTHLGPAKQFENYQISINTLQEMKEAFAQTDQPALTKSDKSDIAALVDAGYTLHEIASARMLSWVDEPDVAPFVQDFKFRRRIYGLGHELIATALAQIEQPQITPAERDESDSEKRLALALSWIDRTMERIVHLGLKETIFEQSQIGEVEISDGRQRRL